MSDFDIDVSILRSQVEQQQKWREEILSIPFIKFPSDWEVRITPPFGDAVVRFLVRLPSGDMRSIYLDVRDSLGCYGRPYWEVYPWNADIGRCDRDDVTTLLQMIAAPNPTTESSENV